MIPICNVVAKLTHIISVMSQQYFVTKDSILNAIRLLMMMIQFVLVWSRLCPYHTRRGHGCACTTQRFIWVSLNGNYVHNKFHSVQYIFKNNYQDNNQPLCPDHKNIRLQIMLTNAVTSSLDPDAEDALGWETSDCAWINILDFVFHCWRWFLKEWTYVIYFTYRVVNLYFTFQLIIQCAHESMQMFNVIVCDSYCTYFFWKCGSWTTVIRHHIF